MTDRVYPSAKPTAPAKPNLYNPTRHPHHPNPTTRRRSRRSCFCLCCFWSILILTLILLLAAIAGCVIYVIYSPRRPTFSATAVRITKFNLTTVPSDGTTRLAAALNLTLTAKNTNKKITYSYDDVSVSVFSDKVLVANGSLAGFVSYPNEPNVLRSTVWSASELVDVDFVSGLRSNLKRKNGLPMEIEMDTNVVVTMGKFKTRKVGIRVVCEKIKGILPKGKTVLSSSIANAKCKVDLRIKIWKFTI